MFTYAGDMSAIVEIEFIAKPGCHLCEQARTVVDRVVAGLPEGAARVRERNILDEPQLAAAHAEEIPVVKINGRMHTYWRVDEARLRAAIDRAAGEAR